KHATQLSNVAKERDALVGQIENLLVDQTAITALSKHKLVEGGVDLIMPHVKKSIKVVKDDKGNHASRVIGPDGQERISMKQGSTDPMTVDELIESMSKTKPFTVAFAGSGASGSEGAGGMPGQQSAGQQRP